VNRSLTKEDVQGWLGSPTGREVSRRLKDFRKNEMENYVLGGVVVKGNAVETAMNAVELTTRIEMYDMFLNLANELFVGGE